MSVTVEDRLREKKVVFQVSRGSDHNWAEDVLWVIVNWLWLRVILKEGVNKSNHPIQNSLLLVMEPETRDNI
jgi:hypothetical protein